MDAIDEGARFPPITRRIRSDVCCTKVIYVRDELWAWYKRYNIIKIRTKFGPTNEICKVILLRYELDTGAEGTT